MSERKYRAYCSEFNGWVVTYGPRRPTRARIKVTGPMTQKEAEAYVKEMTRLSLIFRCEDAECDVGELEYQNERS